MSAHTLLVAGATGSLGREVVRVANSRGFRVRGLARNEEALRSLEVLDEIIVGDGGSRDVASRATRGADFVLSALGASVQPDPGAGSKSFFDVDTRINRIMVEEARSNAVQKFVYISVAMHERLSHLAYIAAHERVVDAVRESGMEYAIIRPTGFFSAFSSFLGFARKGAAPILGNPEAETNPISDSDLAETAVDALLQSVGEISIGGPEVLTRQEIVEAAFSAVGREPKLFRVPSPLVGAMLPAIGLFNKRLAEITRFYLEVAQIDCVAPTSGSRKIGDYFRDRYRYEREGGL